MNIKNLTLLTVISLSLSLAAFWFFGREPDIKNEMRPPVITTTPTPTALPTEPIPTGIEMPLPSPSVTPISYECPKSDYIDCMPVVAPERQEQCSQNYLNWVELNCPNFKGVAY